MLNHGRAVVIDGRAMGNHGHARCITVSHGHAWYLHGHGMVIHGRALVVHRLAWCFHG